MSRQMARVLEPMRKDVYKQHEMLENLIALWRTDDYNPVYFRQLANQARELAKLATMLEGMEDAARYMEGD